jgi:hypothetical protein
MRLNAIVKAILAIVFTTVNAAVVEKRVPYLGSFILSTQEGCPVEIGSNTEYIQIYYGSACGDCVPTDGYNGTTFKAITNLVIDPKCRVTLFNEPTCTSDGIVSGPNCWTPEGGISAYKVDCPWWPEDPSPGTLEPCSRPVLA